MINRSTDKIYKIIEYLENKDLDGILLIIEASALIKIKLRSLFEKNKKYISIPFYPDDHLTLSKFAINFIKKKI